MKVNSWVSRKCRTSSDSIDGSGVFAVVEIKRGEIVAIFGGKIATAAECELLSQADSYFSTHTLSLYPGIYLGSHAPHLRDDAELFNRSCEPNLGVLGQIVVVARRDIQAGEELVFDYETSDDSLDPFECNCGSPECRKRIDGSAWKSKAFQAKHSGWFSWFLERKIAIQTPNPSPPTPLP